MNLILRCSLYSKKLNNKCLRFIKRKVRTRSIAPIYHVGEIPARSFSGKVLQKILIMK
jgi:hypothetical protein